MIEKQKYIFLDGDLTPWANAQSSPCSCSAERRTWRSASSAPIPSFAVVCL